MKNMQSYISTRKWIQEIRLRHAHKSADKRSERTGTKFSSDDTHSTIFNTIKRVQMKKKARVIVQSYLEQCINHVCPNCKNDQIFEFYLTDHDCFVSNLFKQDTTAFKSQRTHMDTALGRMNLQRAQIVTLVELKKPTTIESQNNFSSFRPILLSSILNPLP